MGNGADRSGHTVSEPLTSDAAQVSTLPTYRFRSDICSLGTVEHGRYAADTVIALRPLRQADVVLSRSDFALTEQAGQFCENQVDVTVVPDQMPPSLAGEPVFLEFGPFRLFPVERRLLKDSIPIDLGSRALDILVLLSENAGDVVSKHSIVDRVWPGINVEESSLRVHIAKLRKALGDGNDGVRYIANIAGRGYSLVASVMKSKAPKLFGSDSQNDARGQRLPRLPKVFGRDGDISKVASLVQANRFVTIHGFGGIGKTTVAVAVAERLAGLFKDGVIYLDLYNLCSPDEIEAALAEMLGRTGRGRLQFIEALRDKCLLIVLDGCEHLIDAAASIAEIIWREAAGIAILATSREPLRALGEHVHTLLSLDMHPNPRVAQAGEIWQYASAQLLLERAVAAGYQPEHSDREARYVADICRKLDGIALALELVASRIVVHGLEGADALVGGKFTLSWQGRRTAMPRQQTLMSSLDWSHDLLGDTEKLVLRRLSLLGNTFTLDDVQIISGGDEAVSRRELIDALGQLVAKSFVLGGRDGVYRIFEIVRTYGWDKLTEANEVADSTARPVPATFRLTK